MAEAMYWKEITVNWGESDPFGLVYYPRIVAWFNDTEHDFFRTIGYPIDQMIRRDRTTFVMGEIHFRFIGPAAYGDGEALQRFIETTNVPLFTEAYGAMFRQAHVVMSPDARQAEKGETAIDVAHKAIQATGRPIILSLSPGETPVIRGDHVRNHAQMWRISDDFWDEWPMLEAQFTRLENWTPWRGPGSWPDADMLPLGRLALGQRDIIIVHVSDLSF